MEPNNQYTRKKELELNKQWISTTHPIRPSIRNHQLQFNFLHKKENLIVTGSSGCGKSFLAQSIGVKACQMLHRTLYYNTARFFDLAKLAKL